MEKEERYNYETLTTIKKRQNRYRDYRFSYFVDGTE